jgi:2-phospho-L-lactate guanylyltransferase
MRGGWRQGPTIATVSRPARERLSEVHAVVPIRSRDEAKTRLGLALDPEERGVLVLGMLANTIHVLDAWSGCRAVHVVTADPGIGRAFPADGDRVRFVAQPPRGALNEALRAGRRSATAAGATAVLMIPADLPLLQVESLDRLLEAADAALAAGHGGPVVVIAPADARGGTNALLLAPPTIISPQFGTASLEAHLRAAAIADASVQLVDDPRLGFDLDTPDDLERLDVDTQLSLERLGERLAARLTHREAATPVAAEL